MKVGVIADDLTGANATGVKLVDQGLDVHTYFNEETSITTASDVSVCINTESRYIAGQDAKQRVNKAIQTLRDYKVDVLTKRIDSTFRGNIGKELDAMLEELSSKTVAIIVPSYPSSNRILIGGFLLVNGVPLQQTDVSNDPVTPLKDSYLPKILKKQTDKNIALVTLDKVMLGKSSIEQEINRYINRDIKLIMLDATCEQDIESIAKAMLNITSRQLIPVDPGPLTNYYIANLQKHIQHNEKILVSIGSATSVTTQQVQFLEKKLNAVPVYINPNKLVNFDNSLQDEVARSITKTIKVHEYGNVIIITTNHPEVNSVDIQRLAEKKGVSIDLLTKRISSGLAKVSKSLIENSEGKIQACFFSGGDTTASFCKTVHAKGMKLEKELMPLVAHVTLLKGDFPNLPIVTKGGMVGEPDAIYKSVIYLQKILSKNRRLLLNG